MTDRRPGLPLPTALSADQDPDGAVTSGVTESLWTGTTRPIRTQRLDGDTKAEACIIGAGISGLTTAYLLAKAGVDVVVLEDGAVGSGETGRTTAHFTNALDDRYHTIESKHGKAAARLAAQSHTLAIETVARILEEEGIRCHPERVDGYLFVHPTDDRKSLETEEKACRRAGLDVELVPSAPHFDSGPALRFPQQLQLNPLEYLRGLAQAVQEAGGRVFTDTHARFPEGNRVKANDHTVDARNVIVCSNPPVTTKLSLHAKMLAYRTYVIAGEVPDDVPHAMWWDTGDYEAPSPFPPYHYVRLQRMADGRDMLISGGQDHKVGQFEHVEVDPYIALEEWTKERFPQLRKVEYRWSGEVLEPSDHLAYIGAEPVQRGRFLATGDSGNGMTHGTLAGIILSDLVRGRSNPFEKLYSPRRRTLRAAGAVLREHLQTAKKITRYVQPGDVESAADLAPGEGAVMGSLQPKAVYRDDKGKLHACSAVCPHLKCVVAWNPAEKSFDCPCHGSRFTAYGKVVSGPSNADLEEAKLDAKERGPERHPTRPAPGARNRASRKLERET
jgi:glycine/D-amino acid oxidase-like deaminating enzyme